MNLKQILMFISLLIFMISASEIYGGLFDNIKDRIKNKTKEEAEKRINRRIDNKIDKSFDDVEDTIDGKKEKISQKNDNSERQESSRENHNQNNETQEQEKSKKNQVSWSRFDFVPGDEVIFEDAPSVNEETGEFPSRWDLSEGQVEIMNINGDNVIGFIDGNPRIIPYLKNSAKDYLPDVFTIEFDLYRPAGSKRFFCQFYDIKNQKVKGNKEITIGYNYISVGDIRAEYPGRDYTWRDKSMWLHISIAYTKGKLKMYMDDTRLINIPRYEANPTGFSLNGYFANNENIYYVKNFRIAKGGVKYYDRAMQDGKIIVNGIKFDINKTTLRPESIGPINKIYKLMQEKPELKFSVEGHTDSDGDDAKNQTLSEGRAKTVMEKLVAMGINKNRLISKGWGESKPIAGNNTPEGKANNRRVEFVVIH